MMPAPSSKQWGGCFLDLARGESVRQGQAPCIRRSPGSPAGGTLMIIYALAWSA